MTVAKPITIAFLCGCLASLCSRAIAQRPAADRPRLAQQVASPDASPPRERVTHYALLSTGPAYGERLAKLYWDVNEGMYRVLRDYGYPDEAIYRFAEYGHNKPPNVDGLATLKNFRATFEHLKRYVPARDHVFIFVVGHASRSDVGYGHSLLDGKLTASEFGKLISGLPTENLTIVIHPCHSGAFLPRASRRGAVIVTSVNADEVNAVPWAEAFIGAFAKPDQGDTDGDGRVSMLEAYHAALKPGRERYGDDLREHPLLDDNGDRIGTYLGAKHVFNGDGLLAVRRFLSPAGRKLSFPGEAIRKLVRTNAHLVFE